MASKIKNTILYICIPAGIMYLFEAYTHNPFVRMRPGIQVLNIFLFILINTLLFFITGRLRLSLHIMTVFFMIFGLAEYYLVEFRGVTLLPWDIGSLATAAEVAGGYDYVPGTRAILCIFGFILVFIVSCFADLKLKVKRSDSEMEKRSKRKLGFIRLFGALVSVFFIVLYTLYVQTEGAQRRFGFYTKLFTPTAISERDGTLTAFLMELQYVNVKKPDGYTKEAAKKLLEECKPVSAGRKADIIVIMNEAFSDLSVLGELKTSEDYMPCIHSLQRGEGGKRAETGLLNVSIVGGNTPNTEFEFLTGDTLAFLPEGCIPYQQYVKEGIYAMPGYLKDQGYTTIGMHPYYPGGWERERVYPQLGFEKALFLEDFDTDAEKIRGYVSDMACSERIIKEYEENLSTGKPFFAFCVTMQNHSPYDSDDYEPDIRIEGAEDTANVKTTERYLSLLKRSDEAFRYLTEYFEKTERPVVIVMFGDHEPSDSVVRPVLTLNGKDTRNLSEEDVDRRYVVPYAICTNFDIEGETGADTSANFLGNRVLELAGAGKDSYRVFLDEVAEKYPVMSAVRTENKDGSLLSSKEIKEDELIASYRTAQYYTLIDNK